MQQLMSYLLWWRGTPRPLTGHFTAAAAAAGQDPTSWCMHSDGATLSRAAACTAPWPPLSIDGAGRAAAASATPLHGTSARVQCRIKLRRPLLLPATYVLAQLRRATGNCAALCRHRHRQRRASVICPPDDLPTVKCCISDTNWIALWVRTPCYSSSHQFSSLVLKYSGVVKMSQVGSS